MDTYGLRQTAHVFAAVSLDEARFFYRFAPVFNGETFYAFVRQLVARMAGRKVFLIIDNAPFHWMDEEGKEWVRQNRHLIELNRLPSYSPEFNPVEGVWKITRKMTTHNRFYHTTDERDAALRCTFSRFQQRPALIANQVARFQ